MQPKALVNFLEEPVEQLQSISSDVKLYFKKLAQYMMLAWPMLSFSAPLDIMSLKLGLTKSGQHVTDLSPLGDSSEIFSFQCQDLKPSLWDHQFYMHTTQPLPLPLE